MPPCSRLLRHAGKTVGLFFPQPTGGLLMVCNYATRRLTCGGGRGGERGRGCWIPHDKIIPKISGLSITCKPMKFIYANTFSYPPSSSIIFSNIQNAISSTLFRYDLKLMFKRQMFNIEQFYADTGFKTKLRQ